MWNFQGSVLGAIADATQCFVMLTAKGFERLFDLRFASSIEVISDVKDGDTCQIGAPSRLRVRPEEKLAGGGSCDPAQQQADHRKDHESRE